MSVDSNERRFVYVRICWQRTPGNVDVVCTCWVHSLLRLGCIRGSVHNLKKDRFLSFIDESTNRKEATRDCYYSVIKLQAEMYCANVLHNTNQYVFVRSDLLYLTDENGYTEWHSLKYFATEMRFGACFFHCFIFYALDEGRKHSYLSTYIEFPPLHLLGISRKWRRSDSSATALRFASDVWVQKQQLLTKPRISWSLEPHFGLEKHSEKTL